MVQFVSVSAGVDDNVAPSTRLVMGNGDLGEHNCDIWTIEYLGIFIMKV